MFLLSWDLSLRIDNASKFMLIVLFLITLSIILYIIISPMILTEQKNNEQILQSSSILSPLFFTWTYGQSSIKEITETGFSYLYTLGMN